jgi:hypothetical protein
MEGAAVYSLNRGLDMSIGQLSDGVVLTRTLTLGRLNLIKSDMLLILYSFSLH